jgi:hypothetical protein
VKYNKYPKFNPNDKNIATSIYYYKLWFAFKFVPL